MVVTMTVKVPGGKRRIAEGRRVASKKGRYTEVGFCYFGLILDNFGNFRLPDLPLWWRQRREATMIPMGPAIHALEV